MTDIVFNSTCSDCGKDKAPVTVGGRCPACYSLRLCDLHNRGEITPEQMLAESTATMMRIAQAAGEDPLTGVAAMAVAFHRVRTEDPKVIADRREEFVKAREGWRQRN